MADDIFSLIEHIMNKYNTYLNKGSLKRVYNYKFSRTRRIIENTFGLGTVLYSNYIRLCLVFRKPVEIKVENIIMN